MCWDWIHSGTVMETVINLMTCIEGQLQQKLIFFWTWCRNCPLSLILLFSLAFSCTIPNDISYRIYIYFFVLNSLLLIFGCPSVVQIVGLLASTWVLRVQCTMALWHYWNSKMTSTVCCSTENKERNKLMQHPLFDMDESGYSVQCKRLYCRVENIVNLSLFLESSFPFSF